MRSLITSFCILFVFVMAGCSSDPVSAIDFDNGTFQAEAKVQDTVHTLNTGQGILLAGTTQGAIKKNIGGEYQWNFIGLQVESAAVVDFIIKNTSRYIAAVEYHERANGRPTLFETKTDGTSWNEIPVSYNEEAMHYFAVTGLETNPETSDKIFADNSGFIIESTDGGASWSKIFTGTYSHLFHLSAFHPQQLWIGGQTNIFSPYLAKTQDGGQTWTVLSEQFFSGFNTETIIKDAILHPDKSNHVLVGAGGAITPANVIRKSTDGGQSWQTVLENINGITLTHSAPNPEVVYASGRNPNGTLFFAASPNFGDSWERVQWDDSPAGVQVNDMVSVMEDGREVLYFGTNKGVFTYRFEN